MAEGIDVAPWAMGGTGALVTLQPLRAPRALRRARSTVMASLDLSAGLDFIEAQGGVRRLQLTNARRPLPCRCARFRGLSSTVPLTSRRARRSCPLNVGAISTLPRSRTRSCKGGGLRRALVPIAAWAHAPRARTERQVLLRFPPWAFQHGRGS